MKVAVINKSSQVYNLACHKIKNYHLSLGDEVIMAEKVDLFCLQAKKAYLSAIFSWDVPNLVQDAQLLLASGIEVEIGGPGTTYLQDYIKEKTGLTPKYSLDQRFEHQPGDYELVFTSRGCPRACPFCVVKEVEGTTIQTYPDFPIPSGPNPMIGDNNLLSTPIEHQKMVVEKLKHLPQIDINSGFDCRVFAKNLPFYFKLYSKLKIKYYRFAWDRPEQEKPIERTLKYLYWLGLDRHKVMVYILINWPGISVGEARRRAERVIKLGGMPYLMRFIPLDSLDRNYVAPEWTEGDIEELRSYYNFPQKWMSFSKEEALDLP